MATIEKTGKTAEEAIAAALSELNLTEDQVNIEVVNEGKNGFFGFLGKKAKVLVTPKGDVADVMSVITTVAAAAMTEDTVKVNNDGSVLTTHREEKIIVKKEFVVNEEALEVAKEFLAKIFEAMKIKVVMEKFVNKAEGNVVLKLHGADMGILIGKHGQTLDALQYLTNLVANKNSEGRMHIIIDVENYRDKRVETLTKLAKRLADKVKRSGEKVALEPMNPHERKIIHTALQDDKKIVTFSEGNDPYRKVVIELKK